MVAFKFRVDIEKDLLDTNRLHQIAATQASKDARVGAQVQAGAEAIADGARSALASATPGPGLAKEFAEVKEKIEIVSSANYRGREQYLPGSIQNVYLVKCNHPAAIRWENGTRRTPTTHFMLTGLRNAGGK